MRHSEFQASEFLADSEVNDASPAPKPEKKATFGWAGWILAAGLISILVVIADFLVV